MSERENAQRKKASRKHMFRVRNECRIEIEKSNNARFMREKEKAKQKKHVLAVEAATRNDNNNNHITGHDLTTKWGKECLLRFLYRCQRFVLGIVSGGSSSRLRFALINEYVHLFTH